MRILSLLLRLTAAIGLLALLSACSDAKSSADAPPASPPPSAVSVIEVVPEALPILNELPGRITPTRIAEVRPRVSGIVLERVFEQGSMVMEGDVLYRIDPALFQAQVASAEATLQRAQAVQLQARQQAGRQSELRERNVSSGQQLDNAVAALAQADADVAIATAGLATAQLNLGYAEIKAPISGRIGRANVTEGALVSANGPESLATIQQIDPVYADFTQSANELLQLRRALENGALTNAGAGAARVMLRLDDGSEYKHPGKLLFLESAVDATTGQVTLRGEFPNPEGDLLPGMFVRVLIEQGIQKDAIAIPQQAIQRDAGGRSQVYVVNDKKLAELRTVQVGRVAGDRWVVEDGLKAGDKVIVEGFQKVRPGAAVAAQLWKPQDRPAAGGAGSEEPGSKPTAG
ncbi:efflux RND transporter periplasmic adaptor subunit [Pseudaminobacter soli (ex Li et al. 2025)]|uniref:Efflux transporter periplasmic adaptor subunit n=1 Tax=Pseudaminobacter soli (ex Li et al. 2025) TaxID=1295366 RepID=A0A2P7S3P9_9HYPH|nr:efflux RND transporter periplasmic adaptor subunit [Mesorhizobium soli]PSJ57098.1 efflux transporter periplasmic adaptor subunit [Mesorhizobium soli]